MLRHRITSRAILYAISHKQQKLNLSMVLTTDRIFLLNIKKNLTQEEEPREKNMNGKKYLGLSKIF